MKIDPLTTPAEKQWRRIGVHHHHGINLPLFSLVTEKSSGIGEYTDLPLLADFLSEVGFDTIQLLPLNDTGRLNSPYSPISALALNPLHLGLSSLLGAEDDPELKKMLVALSKLNKRKTVPYSELREKREAFLRSYAKRMLPIYLEDPLYESFKEHNPWLIGFALFKSIYQTQNGKSQKTWPKKFRYPTEELYEQFRHEVEYHIFIQYLCHIQLKEAHRYALSKKVFLKGDLPILIGRNSSDVWLHPDQFDETLCAGSPPDVFTLEGQNWNMPIYNRIAMEDTGFSWWKQRLKQAEKYYSIYRLDHIVGFYRIFAIPRGKSGRYGRYIPEDERLWVSHGDVMMKLMLSETEMLPIGEDLGIISREIAQNLLYGGIAGTKIMRWEREYDNGAFFIPLDAYSPLGMTSVSTHDSETLEQWWNERKEEAAAFASFRNLSYKTPLDTETRKRILEDSHNTSSLFHINLFFEILEAFDDLKQKKESMNRINIPGTVSKNNWTSKLVKPLEEIFAHKELCSFLKTLSKK